MPAPFSETNPIQIFETESGTLEIKVDESQDTVWLTQDQIATLFDKDRSVISKHIKNIYQEEELDENRVCAFFARTADDGKTYQTKFYNLDLILSVGYRTNSKQATRFRQWASSVLKNYLLQGYALNKQVLETKREQIDEIRQTLDFLVKSGKELEFGDQFLELLRQYSSSLVLLNQFDEGRLELGQGRRAVNIELGEFRELIQKTKMELIKQKEATDLFGQESAGKFESTVAAVYQSFGGQEVYPTLEVKAANLFYLTIKNHPFVDGNKRIGSILLVYFLAKHDFLVRPTGEKKINDNTLVALALLIAQSKPEDKEILVQLVSKLIQK